MSIKNINNKYLINIGYMVAAEVIVTEFEMRVVINLIDNITINLPVISYDKPIYEKYYEILEDLKIIYTQKLLAELLDTGSELSLQALSRSAIRQCLIGEKQDFEFRIAD